MDAVYTYYPYIIHFRCVGGERSASFSKREQLESDRHKARYQKINKEYDVALRKVNEILEIDPDYSEAFFLKDQIVWEGYKEKWSAMSNLNKIIEIVKDDSLTINRWAISLLSELDC